MQSSCNKKMMGAYSQEDSACYIWLHNEASKFLYPSNCNVSDDLFLPLSELYKIDIGKSWRFDPHRLLWSCIFQHKWLTCGKIWESDIWFKCENLTNLKYKWFQLQCASRVWWSAQTTGTCGRRLESFQSFWRIRKLLQGSQHVIYTIYSLEFLGLLSEL